MVVFAILLLLLGHHQDLSILTTTANVETPDTGGYLPVFLIAMFMSLFVVYGFDTAGTFGEETVDAGRQAPRGILTAIWVSGVIGAIFLLAIILATPDMVAAFKDPSPISTAVKAGLGDQLGTLYLGVIPVVSPTPGGLLDDLDRVHAVGAAPQRGGLLNYNWRHRDVGDDSKRQPCEHQGHPLRSCRSHDAFPHPAISKRNLRAISMLHARRLERQIRNRRAAKMPYSRRKGR